MRKQALQPGQESVWDYPRPPRMEPFEGEICIRHRGELLVKTKLSYRVLETSHPPVYYLPMNAVTPGCLQKVDGRSVCEWKGFAEFYDVKIAGVRLGRVAWSYPSPAQAFEKLKDHVAFYAGPFDEVTVSGLQVEPQPGEFYGGWITPEIVGPFKGGPGTMGW